MSASNENKEKLQAGDSTTSELLMLDKSQQTDIVGCDLPPDQVAIYGSTVTLEVGRNEAKNQNLISSAKSSLVIAR